MSGHSKWSTIKRKKEKTDIARAKIFTKIGRELSVAVKNGGADPENNTRLRDCIAKAKANNVPNDNIERIIKKAAGNEDNTSYEDITYEGYASGGVAVLVETLTDNRNRTAADLRHYFDKFGGNMGMPGCVSYMFDRRGILAIEKKDIPEETIMEDAIAEGASDFKTEEDLYLIYTMPENFSEIQKKLGEKYELVEAQIEMIPSTYVSIKNKDTLLEIQKLLDMLEDNDDVQNVWHNLEIDEHLCEDL